jgi:hypothetical protein
VKKITLNVFLVFISLGITYGEDSRALDRWLNLYKQKLDNCSNCILQYKGEKTICSYELSYFKSLKKIVIEMEVQYYSNKKMKYLGYNSFSFNDLKTFTETTLYALAPQYVFVDGEGNVPPESQLEIISFCINTEETDSDDITKVEDFTCLEYNYKERKKLLEFRSVFKLKYDKRGKAKE